VPEQRKLIKLASRYPDTSRSTRWRWKREADFPRPVVIRGSEFYYEHELEAFEESHRRITDAERRIDTLTHHGSKNSFGKSVRHPGSTPIAFAQL
jgi:predicted DNA-binding transcriptional regulator AlpA